jgi:hypothetical protein
MEITVSRTGAFAGVEEDLVRVDTGGLDPAQAADLERQVRDVGFFDLPAELTDRNVGADEFRYSVSVVDQGRRHTVGYRDSGDAPGSHVADPVPALRRLVDTLVRQR